MRASGRWRPGLEIRRGFQPRTRGRGNFWVPCWDHGRPCGQLQACGRGDCPNQLCLARGWGPTQFDRIRPPLCRSGSLGWGAGAMSEDALSKAERYRKAANKYAELAKHTEPDYHAELFRKVAVRYVFMAEDLLKWSERRRELDVNALAGTFLDGPNLQSGTRD